MYRPYRKQKANPSHHTELRISLGLTVPRKRGKQENRKTGEDKSEGLMEKHIRDSICHFCGYSDINADENSQSISLSHPSIHTYIQWKLPFFFFMKSKKKKQKVKGHLVSAPETHTVVNA